MAVSKHAYEAIVIGVSAGGLTALAQILPKFDKEMTLPVMIVQHQRYDSDDFLVRYFDRLCWHSVREVEDKMPVESGTFYFAPVNYHLLVEPDKTLSLSTEARVNYSRPSIDVLFESAAETYTDRLVGIILTGANQDGTHGAARIKELGGLIIVQDPGTAEAETMPMSVIKHVQVDHVLALDRIGEFVNSLN
jgi:two-component system chemotaxis response regulator CheB